MAIVRSVDELVYSGFNSQVFALHRSTGELVWDWRSPEGSGFVTIMIDGDQLIVSVNGYMYCLDAFTGRERWRNTLKGRGVGVSSLASVRAQAGSQMAQAAQQQQQAAAAAAGS